MARASTHYVSSRQVTTGEFEVIFDRDVTGCAYIGNVADTTFGNALGLFDAVRRSGNANGIFVQTTNASGTVTNLPFHVAVFC